MTRHIFVIIDPQNDFINLEGQYAKKHPGITQILKARENINRLINAQDKNKVVVIQSDYKAGQFDQDLAICIPNTFGHKLDIDFDDSLTLFTKTQHSCFSSEEFKKHLKDNNIDTLFLCGFLAEYCVRQTALDGLDNGYEVCIVEDCIGTGDDVQDRKQQVIAEFKEKGVKIVVSSPQTPIFPPFS